jgi:hypothetical protein
VSKENSSKYIAPPDRTAKLDSNKQLLQFFNVLLYVNATDPPYLAEFELNTQ